MLRVCVDLNVFVAEFLANLYGRRATLAQRIVEACRRGSIGATRVQLVISVPMLNRFVDVLVREFGVDADAAIALADAIGDLARSRPSGRGRTGGPLLVLGGTGVTPVRDAEDRYVLEAAVVGQADYLVTENMRDFVPPATWLRKPDLAQYESIVVAKPRAFAKLVGL